MSAALSLGMYQVVSTAADLVHEVMSLHLATCTACATRHHVVAMNMFVSAYPDFASLTPHLLSSAGASHRKLLQGDQPDMGAMPPLPATANSSNNAAMNSGSGNDTFGPGDDHDGPQDAPWGSQAGPGGHHDGPGGPHGRPHDGPGQQPSFDCHRIAQAH